MADNEMLDGFLEDMGFSDRVEENRKKREEATAKKSQHPMDLLETTDEELEAESAKQLLESALEIVRDGDLRRRIKKFLKEAKTLD